MPEAKETAPNFATPILDSGVLPARVRRTTLRGAANGFVCGLIGGLVLLKVVGWQAYDGLYPCLGLLVLIVVMTLVVTIHELGHLAAGWAVGFRFSRIRIVPFCLSLEHGKLRARIRWEMSAVGYAGMHLRSVCRLRRRMLIFVVAGPAANLLSVPATILF
jgi:hypothetical protein